MPVFFISLFAAYFLFVMILLRRWKKALRQPVKNQNYKKDISIAVIVPVRNEVQNIESLLNSLRSQTISAQQIIIVDDHSTDGTKQAVQKKYGHAVELLELTEGQGKKKALELGILSATASVIVTTDADCTMHRHWLQEIQSIFSDDSIKMAVGGVRIKADTFFSHLQAVEFASLIGTGAASLVSGLPTMCNGANLAFRKDVFIKVGGYGDNFHIPSGDDEFLLRKIFAKYPKGITVMVSPDSVVETKATPTPQDFFHQRIRWASKWRAHRTLGSAMLAVFIFLVHLAVCGVWLTMIAAKISLTLAILLLLSKMVAEFLFLQSVTNFLQVPWKWSVFVFLQIVYSFYVVLFGVMANVFPYRWKGRKFH